MINIIKKSVQGASHKRNGVLCQDAHGSRVLSDGTVIAAVADGHGSKSCPYSHSGAIIAVNAFCRIMEKLYAGYEGNYDQLLSYLNHEGAVQISQKIQQEWQSKVWESHRENKRELPDEDKPTEKVLLKLRRPDSASGMNPAQISPEIYKQYGTTLLGMMLTPEFYFAFQLGDGDICYIDRRGFQPVINAEKILGTETHSLSRLNAWEKAVTAVRRLDNSAEIPAMYMLSTDGFFNSYADEQEFRKSCMEYFEAINTYGINAVKNSLADWLNETSAGGCGDDITLLILYINEQPDPVLPETDEINDAIQPEAETDAVGGETND